MALLGLCLALSTSAKRYGPYRLHSISSKVMEGTNLIQSLVSPVITRYHRKIGSGSSFSALNAQNILTRLNALPVINSSSLSPFPTASTPASLDSSSELAPLVDVPSESESCCVVSDSPRMLRWNLARLSSFLGAFHFSPRSMASSRDIRA